MNSQTGLGREASRQSFIYFARFALPYVISHFENFPYFSYLSAVIEDLILNPDSKRLAINLPPRHGKSFMLVCLVAWYLGNFPESEIILITHSQSLANDLASKVYQLIRSSFFREIFPSFQLQEKRESMADFRTSVGGGFFAGSIDTNVTGRGAHLILIDDALSAQDAGSETARNSVRDAYDGMIATRLNSSSIGKILLMSHRLHGQDLTGHVVGLGFPLLKLPFEAMEKEDLHIRRVRFIREAGDILQPGRLSLEETKSGLAPHVWATQYQQIPTAAHSGWIKAEYFPVIDKPPSGGRDIFSWDLASSLRPESSYSVCIVAQVNGPLNYIKDIFRRRVGYVELKEHALALDAQFRPHLHLVEDASSGRAFVDDLREEGINAILVPARGSKVERAEEVFPKIANKSVWLWAGTSHLRPFIEEWTAFPYGNNDDMVDATTQLLRWQGSGGPPPRTYPCITLGGPIPGRGPRLGSSSDRQIRPILRRPPRGR